VGEPERKRGEEIAGGGVEGSGGALGDGFEAEPVGEGNFLDFGDDVGEALGNVGGEVAQVAQDGGKAGGEEEREDAGDAEDQKDDGYAAGRMIAAKVELRDAIDGGQENYSEEAADVEDQELFPEGVGEGEKKEDGDAEENVAADLGAGVFFIGGEVLGCGAGQLGSPGVLASGTDLLDAVCSVARRERECVV